MLSVHSISKTYGVETILKNISFNLNSGERLGLIGPNGCGKTTLLRILAGLESPDSGGYHFNPPNLRVGYLPQGFSASPEETIQSFAGRMVGDPDALSLQLEKLSAGLARNPNQPDLQGEYDNILSKIETAAQSAGQAPTALAALGLNHFPPDTPVSHLSGGQKTRLALAGTLLASPQLLLLDEPTNHLDMSMLEWLEEWLVNAPARERVGILIVSHDRAFLDNTVTGILELNNHTHIIRSYTGGYSDYLERKLSERARQEREYSDQQEEIARLRRAAQRIRDNARFKRGGKGDSGDKYAKGFFANRTKGTFARAKSVEARLEHLMGEERVEKPGQSWQIKANFFQQDFVEPPTSGRDVLTLEELSIGYGDQALVRDINMQLRYGERVALIGPNGAGKTTLLRVIAGELPPLAGRVRIGANVNTGYMDQEQVTLNPKLDALTTIRRQAPLSETGARRFLHQFLFSGDEVFTPVLKLSYGQRSRLSLACLVAQGCNLLLLDEPVNHLDIPSRSRFEEALGAFQGTVLAVVHDRYFIQGFATRIWAVERTALRVR